MRTSKRYRSPSERGRTQGSKRRREERNRIAWDQDWKCHYCGRELYDATATIEHLVPLSQGGTNQRTNKVVACYKCNHARSRPLRREPPPKEPPA